MRLSRPWIGLAALGVASAACSALLDLEAPPIPDAGAPTGDATTGPDAASGDGATGSAPDAPSGPTGDGAIMTPPVCASLGAVVPDASAEATYHAFGIGDGGATSWAIFDTTTVDKRAQFFAGGAFDGRFVYFAPATSGVIARFDTASPAGFQLAAAWSAFDVATLTSAASAGGFSGAWYDGAYVYFVPHGLGGVASGVVVRLDPGGDARDPASWATFDTGALGVDGGTPAKGFSGASSDGRYLYFVPNGASTPDGRVVRYDTSRSSTTPPVGAGRPDAGAGDAGAGDSGIVADSGNGVVPGSFEDPSLWQTFDVSAAIPGAAGFTGAAFDGRSLYLVPFSNGGLGNNGYSGIAARFKTDAGFATASSWSPLDLTTVNGLGIGFSGAAFDGRSVYFVPHQRGVVVRLDTTSSQPSSPAAWSAYDVASLIPSDAGTQPQFAGAAFDGRFVYLVPSTAGFGVAARYDTLSTFTSDCAWSTVDSTQLDPAASFYFGAVFDGEYVYFVPRGSGLVARFDAKTPPSSPNLPAFHGSFY